MPWWKYTTKAGKHSPVYHISRGVQVRRNDRCKWVIFVKRGGECKTKTIGAGRQGLAKAVKGAKPLPHS